MPSIRRLLAVVAATLVLAGHAEAQIPLDGWFIALSDCPAYKSFHQRTNPGNVRTTIDRAYPLRGKNAHAASHYLIEVRGATPAQRWVDVSCGVHVVLAERPVVGPTPGVPAAGGRDAVLAVSWQAAFCETRPSKPECTSMTGDRFDATNLALHGLWPQPRNNVYCGVSQSQIDLDEQKKWDRLPPVDLTPETHDALARVMPGTQSQLERHEWVKHGSCYAGASADDYFGDAIRLLGALNASPLQDFLESHIGDDVRTDDVRAVFDQAFGAGAGLRVAFECATVDGRRLITEMQINVRGDVEETTDLGALILAASPIARRCDHGIIDPVGLQ